MKILLTTALAGALLLVSTSKASALTTTLYSGTTFPESQSWSILNNASASRTVDVAGTTLDTTGANSTQYGYFRTDQALNRSTGYNLRFDLQLLSEDHTSSGTSQKNTGVPNPNPDDRAGLSLTVISSDKQGIELGFWTDRIWAQEGGAIKAAPTTSASPPTSPAGTRFTQAEGTTTFDTTAKVIRYDLSVVNSVYYLYADGNYTTPILTGAIRDYTGEGAFGAAGLPYVTPNFLFVGDNTTSANANFRMNTVEFSDKAIVPVPFAFNPLFGVGLFALSRLRKARGSAN